ncbi:c-type cytochrome [Burkholderia multivorans]|uniref:Alcohol dehydrogenase n=1 Tax=Burkholderia multivorans TaxID=87883 RepID=A0A2S9MNH7_9BURK|nr:cytochrome c [Burkholderia multivorans]MBR7894605.1 cytochrome c [Burkholderia multivorans]MBU9144445.1 cytochrome c [Burkholderia multivorans]MBU9511809.1 cytochrome c [Burkholderia multivorans]MBU9523318.1 cytochrome c [Burkholderia multivorans]MBU9538347.1 cytochrome c [Burkholderia multivorans]
MTKLKIAITIAYILALVVSTAIVYTTAHTASESGHADMVGNTLPEPGPARTRLIAQGRYVAIVADCAGCHTSRNGASFAGGLGIDTPVGRIYSTNITPDAATGIGRYTLDEFDRAVRRGIGKRGDSLYPAMPYVSFSRMTTSDVKALYAYMMLGVRPVARANRHNDIPWPLSMRWPLSLWRMLFAPDITTPSAAPLSSALVARGRYLVEGPAHCGACHTPRGIAFQEKALTGDDARYLSGGLINGYLAKNLRGNRRDGLGDWRVAEIVDFLKTGRTCRTAAFGDMSDVIGRSTQHMTDTDLAAIASFLKTLSATDADAGNRDAPNASAIDNGRLTYRDNCAACHRTDGTGYGGTFPDLVNNTVVNSDDPTSLIHLVLTGGSVARTRIAPTVYGMPGFADRLTDRDVADVLSYICASWGNRAPGVAAAQVAAMRATLKAAPQPTRRENR